VVLLAVIAEVSNTANNHMHSDNKKQCGFRYATATPLFAAGDVRRYAKKEKYYEN